MDEGYQSVGHAIDLEASSDIGDGKVVVSTKAHLSNS